MTRRVLHVSQPVDAGVPAVVARYAADQVARGLEVVVACPGDPLAERAEHLGASVRRWQATRSPGPSALGEARALARVVADVAPDVVHLHSAKAGLAGRLAVRGRRPTVFQPHAWSFDAVTGPVARASLAWERLATRWTDVTVCVSEEEAERGRRAGVRGTTLVVPNTLDPAAYPAVGDDDRAAARRRLGLDERAPLAVCIGRLARQKGQDRLLDAWPQVSASVPAAQLALVGDGPDREEVERRARDLPRVIVNGPTDRPRTWLLAADVVVVPSRWEGMALVPLEARACSRAVVASSATGLAETVTDGTGAVVAVEPDGLALAAAVTARLSDRSLADAEGARARRETEESWTLPSLDALDDLYARLLAR